MASQLRRRVNASCRRRDGGRGIPAQLGGPLTGLPPGSRVAGYLLERLVGVGGMAVVYRARDERLGRSVALKVLAGTRRSGGQGAVHPRGAGGRGGGPPAHHPRLRGRRGRRPAVHRDAVRGRADLHGLHPAATVRCRPGGRPRSSPTWPPRSTPRTPSALVHRDVKPGNILVDPGAAARARLPDGLRHRPGDAVGGRADVAGQFIGTPDYGAPEQINGTAGRRPGRPVRARLRGLRAADRHGPVQAGRPDGGALRARLRRPAAR